MCQVRPMGSRLRVPYSRSSNRQSRIQSRYTKVIAGIYPRTHKGRRINTRLTQEIIFYVTLIDSVLAKGIEMEMAEISGLTR